MEPNWLRFYDITKRVLAFNGQWPYQRRRTKLLGLSLVTISTLSVIVTQVGQFIHCNGNVHCIFGTVPSVFLTTIILVKLYTCQFNANSIKRLTDYLLSNWEKVDTPEEYKIMKMYAANGRQLTLIYALYLFITCFLFITVSLTPHILDIILPLNEPRPILLPYEAYYFVDEKKYFTYIFLHSFLASQVSISAVVAHDCMFITYTEHVCSLFAVTGFRFENLVNEDMDTTDNKVNQLYDKKIAYYAQSHRRALEFADLLEDTFTIAFAIQLAMSTAWISITLLQIALQSGDFIETGRYVAFIIGQLIHLFFFSIQGQKMIDHSVEVRDNVYNSLWYKIPVRSQKMLLNVMRRSLQPNSLSAGKIYIFSLKSFAAVVQTSVSYFTVLASFQ